MFVSFCSCQCVYPDVSVCARAKVAAVEKPAWTVLRDDFMMGATMKDWDKSSDQDEPQEGSSEAATQI